jgi:hypothetical protein
MKIVLVAPSIVLATTLSFVFVCAQSPMPAPPFGPTHIGGDERPDAPTKDDFRRIPHPQRQFGPVREKRVLKKGLLAPSSQDSADNATLLQQKDTGLIKLLPRETGDRTAKRVKIRGGGAYFSFFYLSHDNIYGADLQLAQNTLLVNSPGPDYGILTELGDVSLVDVSVNDSRAVFIGTYKPARNGADARCEIQRFHDGVTMNGSLYDLSLPVKVNSTYLLRSINYGRSDLLVGFRITRQESDGSITILWKLLKQYWRPTLERVVYVNPVSKCPTK